MDAIRSEWIKLSTLMVNKVLVGIALVFPIVVTTLVTGLGDDIRDIVDLNDMIGTLALLSTLLIGVVATINMSGEFNYNTIRPTFAAQPKRMTPLLAKLMVGLLVAAVVAGVYIAASWVIGINLVGDDGFFPVWSFRGEPSPARAGLLGTFLFAIGTTIMGFGLGNLIRNTPAAVTALLLWPLVLENILARLLFAALGVDLDKYLPFTEGITLGFIDRSTEDGELMARFNGGVYFFAWAIGITILGLIRTNRSDA